jgi:hypothetical protein
VVIVLDIGKMVINIMKDLFVFSLKIQKLVQNSILGIIVKRFVRISLGNRLGFEKGD